IIQKKQSSLNRLRNNNIYLSLNDFGIGYAELSHLQNIPLSYISLHKTIFHNIEDCTVSLTKPPVVTAQCSASQSQQ
ncbi:EAL domain-containing protein, partial [Escherichia coli]|nr:EAL domain-containing protein [Escherichia coli]